VTTARITEIHVEGLRTLADVRLKLDGLTVLIGENGTGKSSIIEACELLRRMASQDFMSEFYNPHGGAFALLRDGASTLRLTVCFQASFPGEPSTVLEYRVGLAREGAGVVIHEEHLRVTYPDKPGPWKVIDRGQRFARYFNGMQLVPLESLAPTALALAGLGTSGPRHWAIGVVREALRAIDVHLPFEVLPSWAARAYSRKSEIRGSVLLQPADRLDLLGSNLVNVYYALREQSDRAYWDDTMDLLRLGLGGGFEEVRSAADPGGGAHAIAVKWRGRDQPMPASALSDGQIAFLAFVGLYRLPRSRALLAIDEPELHLHPGLLARVVQIFEAMAEQQPVLLSTHSDRLLDAVADPVAAVRVCELRDNATQLRRLDAASLAVWLADYRGLGDLRSEGHLVDVLEDAP
jgi:predicted ATPase